MSCVRTEYAGPEVAFDKQADCNKTLQNVTELGSNLNDPLTQIKFDINFTRVNHKEQIHSGVQSAWLAERRDFQALSAQALDCLWLCICWSMVNGQAQTRSFSAQKQKYTQRGSRFGIHYYRFAVYASRILLVAGRSDPHPSLPRDCRTPSAVGRESRLSDIQADLLDLSARFETHGPYYAAQDGTPPAIS
jgi:hypothetical protein